jgi:hypothetical protein
MKKYDSSIHEPKQLKIEQGAAAPEPVEGEEVSSHSDLLGRWFFNTCIYIYNQTNTPLKCQAVLLV